MFVTIQLLKKGSLSLNKTIGNSQHFDNKRRQVHVYYPPLRPRGNRVEGFPPVEPKAVERP